MPFDIAGKVRRLPRLWPEFNVVDADEFPLCVKSRHGDRPLRCPLYPQKRTLAGVAWMSALCQ